MVIILYIDYQDVSLQAVSTHLNAHKYDRETEYPPTPGCISVDNARGVATEYPVLFDMAIQTESDYNVGSFNGKHWFYGSNERNHFRSSSWKVSTSFVKVKNFKLLNSECKW